MADLRPGTSCRRTRAERCKGTTVCYADQRGGFVSADYARQELVAEMASAFACASLSIRPTVRHDDSVGSWLAVLRKEEKAIFRAASAASKAADYLLAFAPGAV